MIRLSSSSPVTASSRSGGLAIPARSSSEISVASPSIATWPNSSSRRSKRSRRCSISVTSCPMSSSERVTFLPTLPPPAMITYTASPRGRHGRLEGAGVAGAHGVGEDGDRRLGGTDRAQAALAVEVGAQRVEHAHDHAVDAEALLQHLADDDVRVVAVGGDDRRVRLLDAGLAEHVAVHAVADDEAPAPALAEPVERLLVLVHARHLPPLGRELYRDRGADAAAADHHALHALSVDDRTPVRSARRRPRTRPRGRRRRAPGRGRAGARGRRWERRNATAGASAARSRARSGRRAASAPRRRSRARSSARRSSPSRRRRRCPPRGRAPPPATGGRALPPRPAAAPRAGTRAGRARRRSPPPSRSAPWRAPRPWRPSPPRCRPASWVRARG